MAEDDEMPATMNDIKEMTSSMDKRMDEMHEMIASLINAQAAIPSASSPTEDHLLGKKPVDNEEDGGRVLLKIKIIFLRNLLLPKVKMGKRSTMRYPQITLPTP